MEIITNEYYKDDYFVKDFFIFCKIQKHFPSNRFFYLLNLFLQELSFIVITHDWNINSNKGISYWIRKFTLTELISNNNNKYLFYIILFIIFMSSLFIVITNCFFKKKITKVGNLFHRYKFLIKFYSLLTFFVCYLFPSYEFSVFVELIANKKYRKNLNIMIYILICIIILLVTIFIIATNLILNSIIFYQPNYLENRSIFILNINNVAYSPIFILLSQALVQLEFILKFKYIVIIKIVYRGIYFLFYVKTYFRSEYYFYKFSIYYYYKLFQTFCFVSCFIEYIFLFDYKNDLIFLQKDYSMIILKLLNEIIFGFLLTEIFFYIDDKNIKKSVLNFSSKYQESFNYKIIKFFNMLYYNERPQKLRILLKELNLKLSKVIHFPKCKESSNNNKDYEDENVCFFCHKYSLNAFEIQINKYMEFKNNNIIKQKNYNLKENFPLLFDWINLEILNLFKTQNFNNKKLLVPIFVIITFSYIYEKKYLKCLYLIEKLINRPQININFFGLYQLKFFKYKIIKNFKKYMKNKESIYVSQQTNILYDSINLLNVNFTCFSKIMKLEIIYIHYLNNYIQLVNLFRNNSIGFKKFKSEVEKFYSNTKNTNKITNQLLNSYTCNIPYYIEKIKMFFFYFFSQIPECVSNNLFNFFNDKIKIENNNSNLILLLDVDPKNNMQLKINYFSDDLLKILKYDKNDFKKLNLKNIFAKTFYKSYIYTFKQMLIKGIPFLEINNFCLIDKNQYIILFNIIILLIYKKHEIQFFIRLDEVKEDLIFIKHNEAKKSNDDSKNEQKIIEDNESNKILGSCFVFTNKNGKIINLSKGFDDFFFLTSDILIKYNINIMELFKLEKLDRKGNFTKKLLKVYENINEIFIREVGQLGEDSFSKIINQINNSEKSIKLLNSTFLVNIIYESKEIRKDSSHIKKYYIFIIKIYEDLNAKKNLMKDTNNFFTRGHTLNVLNNDISIDIYENAHINQIYNHEKYNQTIKNKENYLIEKIKEINDLSSLILFKIYNIEPLIDSNISNKKLNKRIRTAKRRKTLFKLEVTKTHSVETLNLLNHQNTKNIKLNKNKFSVFEKYITFLFIIIFFIIIIILFVIKLQKIKEIKTSYIASNDLIMMEQNTLQIILKILLAQFQANKLQPLYIDTIYDNSFKFHITQLGYRIDEFLYFSKRFFIFFNPTFSNIDNENFGFLSYQNYAIPTLDGLKTDTIIKNILSNFQNSIFFITNNSEIILYYNNSEYYYTEKEINQTNLTHLEFYSVAINYIKNLVTLSKLLNYQYTELILFVRQYIYKKINQQYEISIINMVICICFSLLMLYHLYYIYVNSILIFAKYFYTNNILIYFNYYLSYKTELIKNYINNYSNHKKILINLNNLEIVDHNEIELLYESLNNDSIDNDKLIKINPFRILKKENYILHNESFFNKSINEFRDNNINIYNKGNHRLFSKPYNKIIEIITLNEIKNTRSKIYSKNNKKKMSSFLNLASIQNSENFNDSSKNVNIPKKTKSNKSLVSLNDQTNNSSNNLLLNNSIITKTSNIATMKTNNIKVLNNNIKDKINSKNISSKDKENFLKTGQSILIKSCIYLNTIFLLITLLIIFVLVSILQIIISKYELRMLKDIARVRDDVFGYFNYLSQFVIDYEIQILLNEVLTVNYTKISSSILCDDIDLDPFRYVFNDLITCYPFFEKETNKMISGQINSKLKNFRKFYISLNDEYFCQNIAEFLSKNKDEAFCKELITLQTTSYDLLYNECVNIGGGINNKGITAVVNLIYNNMIILYNDFIKDNNRTSENNLKRLNNNLLLSFQNEISRVMRKIPICLYINFYWDFENITSLIFRNEWILFLIEIIIFFIIGINYFYNLTSLTNDNKKIEFFNECLINTIIFK